MSAGFPLFVAAMVAWNIAVVWAAMTSAIAFVFRRPVRSLAWLAVCVVLLLSGVGFVDWLARAAS